VTAVFLRVVASFLIRHRWLAAKMSHFIIVFWTVISKHLSTSNFDIHRVSIIFLIYPVFKLLPLILQVGLDIWEVPSAMLVASVLTLTLKLTHVFFAKVSKDLVELGLHRYYLIVFIIRLLCGIFLVKLDWTSFFAKDEAI